jgi:hypothetical protein
VPGRDDLARADSHRVERRRRGGKLADDLGRVLADKLAVRIGLSAHDHRLHEPASVGHRGVGVEHLQRRDGDHVLTDAGLCHLAREHAGAALAASPLGAGDDAPLLAGKPDPGELAEAEVVRPHGELVDAGVDGHLVEEGVRALRECVDHVERPEALSVPVE